VILGIKKNQLKYCINNVDQTIERSEKRKNYIDMMKKASDWIAKRNEKHV